MVVALSSFFEENSTSNDSYDTCQKDTKKMPATLVYLLLPVAGLMLLWLRKNLLSQILERIDDIFIPLSHFTLFGRGRALLDWSKKRLPHQWSSSHAKTLSGGLSDFWTDGSLLCTLINTAIPGACANPYGHWKKVPAHAQEVAYKYLGIPRLFTQSDLDLPFTPHIESKLLKYIFDLRKTISKLDLDKPKTTSSKFLARGMGLSTADQHLESEFYIYSKTDISFYNIEVDIEGPYGARFRSTVLEHLAKKREERGASIQVKMNLEQERLKVGYVAEHSGIHLVRLSCNGESVMGSPFYVNVMPKAQESEKIKKREEEVKETKSLVKTKSDCRGSTDATSDTRSDSPPPPNTKSDSRDSPDATKDASVASSNDSPPQLNTKSDSRDSLDASSDTSVASRGDSPPPLKITKYLKDLNNCPPKKLPQVTSEYFSKENYVHVQKLVDSSFRRSCRITRASKLSQSGLFQFSSASPVCRVEHIVPEGCRKLLVVDQRRKVFTSQSPPETSSFSPQENPKEAKITANSQDKLSLDSDALKKTPPKLVQQRKTFWETVAFQDEDKKTINNQTLKHVDSLLRNKSLSKSLNDLSKIDGKFKKYVSIDENLDVCCEISLEDRTKTYLNRVQIINSEFQGISSVTNEDKGRFRYRRKTSI